MEKYEQNILEPEHEEKTEELSAGNKILKNVLLEAMNMEIAHLLEEAKDCDYVFSEKFEKEMANILTVRTDESVKKEKRFHVLQKKWLRVVKYAAAVLVIAFVVGGVFVSQRDSAQASILGIDILGWFDKFFTVEDGDAGKGETDIFFDESQIGYLPEGFEKVSENVMFSQVEYKYQNAKDDYIYIRVSRDKLLLNVDNESAQQVMRLNERGYEYTLISRDISLNTSVMWKDDAELYYYVESSLVEEEILKIMNNIF